MRLAFSTPYLGTWPPRAVRLPVALFTQPSHSHGVVSMSKTSELIMLRSRVKFLQESLKDWKQIALDQELVIEMQRDLLQRDTADGDRRIPAEHLPDS